MCIHCPKNEPFLSLDTVLYQGMGGYHITKDSEVYYQADHNSNWTLFKKLLDIENEIKSMPDRNKHVWEVHLNLPLRDGIWQRTKSGKWQMTHSGIGFA